MKRSRECPNRQRMKALSRPATVQDANNSNTADLKRHGFVVAMSADGLSDSIGNSRADGV